MERRQITINVNIMVALRINNIIHLIVQLMHTNYKILKLRGLTPRANYTDRAAAAGRRS